MDWLYLDNNATTRPAEAVADAMDEVNRSLWANPSSVHRFGQSVRQRVDLARASVAKLIGAKPGEVVFTSGGTESNTLAIRGTLEPSLLAGDRPSGVLISSGVEHSAVREPAEAYEAAGGPVEWLGVDAAGRVELASLGEAIDRHAETGAPLLVSVQWANNETGVIQPIEQVAELIQQKREAARQAGRRLRLHLHVDGTQAVGKLPVDVKTAGVDMMTFSGHKFHGPKGVGGLYIRSGVKLRPQQRGGPQERERRGGTENTPAIVGLGVAADLAAEFVADEAWVERQRGLRDRFEQAIVEAVPHARVNASEADRLWNTSNLAFPGLEAEAILLGLSEKGLCASAGAACSSGSLEPSPVLLAMGLAEPVAHGSVRFSLSRETTTEQIDRAIELVPEAVQRLGQTMPVGEGV
jgi:cysteine desulfurase